jgi:hypothetical protein
MPATAGPASIAEATNGRSASNWLPVPGKPPGPTTRTKPAHEIANARAKYVNTGCRVMKRVIAIMPSLLANLEFHDLFKPSAYGAVAPRSANGRPRQLSPRSSSSLWFALTCASWGRQADRECHATDKCTHRARLPSGRHRVQSGYAPTDQFLIYYDARPRGCIVRWR